MTHVCSVHHVGISCARRPPPHTKLPVWAAVTHPDSPLLSSACTLLSERAWTDLVASVLKPDVCPAEPTNSTFMVVIQLFFGGGSNRADLSLVYVCVRFKFTFRSTQVVLAESAAAITSFSNKPICRVQQLKPWGGSANVIIPHPAGV